jgi:hypothetical protein
VYPQEKRMLEFVVVAEAEADARIACDLADRIFVEEGPDWIDEALLSHLRSWSGLEPHYPYTRWASIPNLFTRFPRVRTRRRTEMDQHKPDYAAGRKAIILVTLLRASRPAALIFVRDLDSQAERRTGLVEAAKEEAEHLLVVIATPNPKREAWVLNGFQHCNHLEEHELSAIREKLKFHPCEQAERLRYSSQTARPERDPKKILERLTQNDGEREARCWQETPLSTLRARGEKTLLANYLHEVKAKLLPLFN